MKFFRKNITQILAILVINLSVIVCAHARSQDDVVNDISALMGKEVHVGDAPDQIVTFLLAHKFSHTDYDRDSHLIAGIALFTRDGTKTTDTKRAAFNVSIVFNFDEHDRLKDYQVESEKLRGSSARAPSEMPEASPENVTTAFASPDKSCRLLYKGVADHGDGVFYDVSGGKNQVILKAYFRLGPDVRWISNSLGEFFFSEGSPAYHSYYYDCKEHRISPSYFLRIAFEPKTRIVAVLESEEIVFYKLFRDKEFYRAKAPGVGLTEYFNCDSETDFAGVSVLHIKMKCHDGTNVDLKIKVPD